MQKIHPTERKNYIGSKYYFMCGYQLTQMTKHGSKSIYREHNMYHVIIIDAITGKRTWNSYELDEYKIAMNLYKLVNLNEDKSKSRL